MSIAARRAAIIDAIKVGMPSLREVVALGGRLDLDEIRRQSTPLPGVVVAALAVPKLELVGGQVMATVRWGAFVACQDAAVPQRVTRDTAVLLLTGELLRLIGSPAWSRKANGLQANSAWSTKLDKQGVAVWAVSWDEKVELVGLSVDDLDDLRTLSVTYDLAPTNGTAEATDHIPLGEEP